MVPKHPLIEKTEWGSEGPYTEAPEDISSDAGGQIQQELLAVLCKSSHSSNTRYQSTNPLQNCKTHFKTRSHWYARPSSTAAGYWCRYCSPRGTFPALFAQLKSSLLPIQLAATRAETRFSTGEDSSQRYICIASLQQGLQSQLSDALDTPVMLFMNLKMYTGFNTLSSSLSVSMWMQFNTIRQDRKLTPFYRINCIQVVGQDKETPGQRAGWPKARHHLQILAKLVRILQGGKAFPKGIASCYRSIGAWGK